MFHIRKAIDDLELWAINIEAPLLVTNNTSHFSVYPNPANDNLNIEFNEFIDNMEIRLINPLGQILLSEDYTNSKTMSLNCENIPAGYYTLNISSPGFSGTQPVIIKH